MLMDLPKTKEVLKNGPGELTEQEFPEPTKEELLEDLRIALRYAIAGEEGMPAREGLESMRRRIYGDAEYS